MPSAPDRILLTGASGFVGQHLSALIASAYPGSKLIKLAVDIRDETDVATAVRDSLPDICVHLAGVSTVAAAAEDETLAWQVNLHGTLYLARAIMRHAPDCQMLFVSSADAYGSSFRSGISVTEETALAPMNTYGATKAAADLALGSMAARGLRVVRLRAFNHTGPGQTDSFVVPAFARQIARIVAGLQEPILRVGNLDTKRDFLDVRDICRAYIACIGHRNTLAPGTILNLASGQAQRIGDLVTALQAMAGVPIEVMVDPTRVRIGDLPLACGDATRAKALIGWEPAIPWNVTLRDVFEDWRNRVLHEAGGN